MYFGLNNCQFFLWGLKIWRTETRLSQRLSITFQIYDVRDVAKKTLSRLIKKLCQLSWTVHLQKFASSLFCSEISAGENSRQLALSYIPAM